MSSPDPIFDQLALAADAEPADSGKTAWPEYPREKASPAEIDQFCKTMTASFEAVGLGALLRRWPALTHPPALRPLRALCEVWLLKLREEPQ